jgi:hypothetical protein
MEEHLAKRPQPVGRASDDNLHRLRPKATLDGARHLTGARGRQARGQAANEDEGLQRCTTAMRGHRDFSGWTGREVAQSNAGHCRGCARWRTPAKPTTCGFVSSTRCCSWCHSVGSAVASEVTVARCGVHSPRGLAHLPAVREESRATARRPPGRRQGWPSAARGCYVQPPYRNEGSASE